MTETRKLKIAAVADLHVKEDDDSSYKEMFAEISGLADVLVIAGDLTDLGKPKEAERLAADLQSCTIPVIAVLGNHDHESGMVDEVSSVLIDAGVKLLNGQPAEVDGVAFVGVKGFAGGFGRHMLGSFGEAAIKAMVAESVDESMRLENAMRRVRSQRAMVVLHYAPVIDTVEGEPREIYPFLGSSRLAETIDRFPVKAVVHGHAHRGTYQGKTPGGAPVYNVAAHVVKPTGKPYALLEL
ncbi:metallophosphoesterase family protein [Rhizobium mesoamericanum]|uniref:Putative serine/threonine-specific protein phosphatase protein n=1 Tax=Rhizobium mesoamericanum STM3625 TaxID=1211777 RepID=K0Q506_9HYPH|nr:metallophosphoesterase [Rhizobium mesoamericanum]CCM78124.1 putative serine/threonine-specific protein phosphatase protein [Rhizobium mesoamericanum STM3625]